MGAYAFMKFYWNLKAWKALCGQYVPFEKKFQYHKAYYGGLVTWAIENWEYKPVGSDD